MKGKVKDMTEEKKEWIFGKQWDAVTAMMDDEIREQVHAENGEYTPEEFFSRYCELDPDFEEVIDTVF